MAVPGRENRLIHNVPGNMVISVRSMDGVIDKHFIAHKHTVLDKLMTAYCHMCRIPLRSVIFLFMNNPINDTDTPESLGISDGAILDLANAQDGPLIVPPYELSTNHIMIHVLRGENQPECSFFILRTTPVIILLKHHYKRFGFGNLAQRFTYRRRIISHTDTAITLGMVDGDSLNIFYAQPAA